MTEPLDARLLQTLVTLAETRSFTLAAHQLHLTQSAVSHQIKQLEEATGTQLFHRSSKDTRLTESGQTLLRYAEEVLAKLEEARWAVSKHAGDGRGELQVGTTHAVAEYQLPPVIEKFYNRFPEYRLNLLLGYSLETVELLLDRKADLGIVELPLKHRALKITPLFQDEVVALVPPKHTWARLATVPPEELRKVSVIVSDRNGTSFARLQDFCKRHSLRMPQVLEAGHYGLVREMAKVGQGIGLLPTWVAQRALKAGELKAVRFPGGGLPGRWGLAHRNERKFNRTETAFLNLCHSLMGV